jgi:hypothetical protein
MSESAEQLAASWAEAAIEEACKRAQEWYRSLIPFKGRVDLRSVIGFKYPELVSEQDCVLHFARFLNEGGVPWEDMHHQLSVSRWLYDHPHPAAEKTPGEKRWRVDLALLRRQDFHAARLPAKEPGFRFDAFLEFAYLDDFWKMPRATPWGEPAKRRKKVQGDVDKIVRYLRDKVCALGYVIVFEECDWEFPDTFEPNAQARGCRVRFIRSY